MLVEEIYTLTVQLLGRMFDFCKITAEAMMGGGGGGGEKKKIFENFLPQEYLELEKLLDEKKN